MDSRCCLLSENDVDISRSLAGTERPLFGNDETATRSRVAHFLTVYLPVLFSALTFISSIVFSSGVSTAASGGVSTDNGGGVSTDNGGGVSTDNGGGVSMKQCWAFSPQAINVILSIVIALITCSHTTVLYWYRQGGLDPKFRILIYFNAGCVLAVCLCANLYIHVQSHIHCR